MISGDELEEPSASNVVAGRRDRSYEVSRNYPSERIRMQKRGIYAMVRVYCGIIISVDDKMVIRTVNNCDCAINQLYCKV